MKKLLFLALIIGAFTQTNIVHASTAQNPLKTIPVTFINKTGTWIHYNIYNNNDNDPRNRNIPACTDNQGMHDFMHDVLTSHDIMLTDDKPTKINLVQSYCNMHFYIDAKTNNIISNLNPNNLTAGETYTFTFNDKHALVATDSKGNTIVAPTH